MFTDVSTHKIISILFKYDLSLGFILKIFLKFRKFQPRYSYKIYSYRKKECSVLATRWKLSTSAINNSDGLPVTSSIAFHCLFKKWQKNREAYSMKWRIGKMWLKSPSIPASNRVHDMTWKFENRIFYNHHLYRNPFWGISEYPVV